MKVLISGGAGYIGSMTARELASAGHEVAVLDNLSSGHREAIAGLPLIEGDLLRREDLTRAFSAGVDAVVHFAALIQMGESMVHPERYYRNNVAGSLNLFETAVENGVRMLVFSSSAGVYGNPIRLPIFEEDPKEPTNPYGETKLVIERMLRWFDGAHGLRSISLRYFNAAGAALDGMSGEDHPDESHLIPRVMQSIIRGEREFRIFGDDYRTPDGTCVRDYIHIADLARAHIMALEALSTGHPTGAYNCGTGRGYSNREVVEAVIREASSGMTISCGPRRPGDAGELVAAVDRIKDDLGWEPHHSALGEIIATAWKWHREHPRGYSGSGHPKK